MTPSSPKHGNTLIGTRQVSGKGQVRLLFPRAQPDPVHAQRPSICACLRVFSHACENWCESNDSSLPSIGPTCASLPLSILLARLTCQQAVLHVGLVVMVVGSLNSENMIFFVMIVVIMIALASFQSSSSFVVGAHEAVWLSLPGAPVLPQLANLRVAGKINPANALIPRPEAA